MPEAISQNLGAIIAGIFALLAGIAITIKVVSNRKNRIRDSANDNSNVVVQQNIEADGDVAGRDINKHK